MYYEIDEQDEQEETLGELMCDDDLKLDHIPDVVECRKIRKQMERDQWWPNVWHINDHGNVDLLSIGYNGAKIVRGWV